MAGAGKLLQALSPQGTGVSNRDEQQALSVSAGMKTVSELPPPLRLPLRGSGLVTVGACYGRGLLRSGLSGVKRNSRRSRCRFIVSEFVIIVRLGNMAKEAPPKAVNLILKGYRDDQFGECD